MKNMDNFDVVINRKETNSLKWDHYKDGDIIPMWVADMDLSSPEVVIEALHRRVDHKIFGYSTPSDKLVQSVLNWCRKRYDWSVEADWLVWLPGLVTGINVACRAFGNSGDEVLTNLPVYPPFLTAPGNFDRKCITFPLQIDETGKEWLDYEKLERAITPRTKLLMFCSPHNPTGHCFKRSELERVLKICEKYDLLICSDEIHCDLILTEGGKHIPFASLGENAAERVITLMAPSKTFNIPGLGCSFAVISSESVRKKFQQAMYGIVPHVNLLGYTAAEAAYGAGDIWLKDLIVYLRKNRDLAWQAINEIPGLKAKLPEATYLLWIDASGLDVPDAAEFFEKNGVGLSAGGDFGAPDFVRLNFACPGKILEKGLKRMAEAVQLRWK